MQQRRIRLKNEEILRSLAEVGPEDMSADDRCARAIEDAHKLGFETMIDGHIVGGKLVKREDCIKVHSCIRLMIVNYNNQLLDTIISCLFMNAEWASGMYMIETCGGNCPNINAIEHYKSYQDFLTFLQDQ